MATELAVAYVSIVPETSKIAPGVKQAFGVAEKSAATSGKSMGSKLASGIGSTLKGGVLTAGAAAGTVLGTALSKGFNRLNALDQAQAKLRGLGRSTTEIGSIMDSVSKSVKGTAFGLDEAANSAAMFSTMGVKSGADMDRIMKLLADTTAQAGSSFDEMAPIFAKVVAEGKLTGDTFDMLNERATGVGEALSKHFNKPISEIPGMVSDGQVSMEDFSAAMEDMIGGAAQETGKTFKGAFDNMNAALGRVGETLLKGAFSQAPAVFGKVNEAIDGVNEKLKAVIEYASGDRGTGAVSILHAFGGQQEAREVTDAIKMVEDKVREFRDGLSGDGDTSALFGNLGDSVGKLWDAAQRLAPAIGDIAGALGQAGLQAGFAALTGVLAGLAPIIADVITPALETLADVMKDNPALVTAVVGAFTGFKALGFVGGIFSSVGGGMKTAGGAAKFLSGVIGAGKGGGVGAALLKMADGAKSANPLIAKMGTSAVNAGKKLVSLGNAKQSIGKLGGALKKAGGAFKAFGKVIMANPMVAIVAAIVAVVAALVWFFTKTELGKKIWKSFMDFLGKAWNWIKDTAVAVWNGIADFFTDLWGNIKSTAETVWNGIKDFFSGLWDGIKLVFTTAWDAVVAYFTTAWDNFKTTVETVWNGIKDFFSLLWEGIKLVFTTAWDMISAFFTTAWTVFTTVVQTVWNGIKTFFSLIWQGIQLVFTTVWTAISGWISSAWSAFIGFVSTVWNGIKNTFSAVWNGIKDAITTIWTAISSWVSGQWSAFTNLVSSVWNAIKSTISTVWENIKSTISNAVSAIGAKLGEWVSTAREKVGEFLSKIGEIPGKITGIFADAGRWLYDAGVAVVQGLIDGIGSLIGTVGGFIKDHLPFGVGGILEGFISADGSIAYANGGVQHNAHGSTSGGRHRRRENHTAQIAAGRGPVRIWAEPETGGESYIPLARNKRRRSSAILAKTAEIMGYTVLDRDGQEVSSDIPGGPGAKKTTQRFAKGGIRTSKEMLDFARGKTVAGQRMDRPLEGAPYQNYPPNGQWGDCSYTSGSLAAFLTGHNPRVRNYATGTQESVLRSWGFTMGRGPAGTFRTGWYNGGPWGGHTASTLPNGTNAEMGGGRGNGQLGGGAAGYNLSGATNWAWMRPKDAAPEITGPTHTNVTGLPGEYTDDTTSTTSGGGGGTTTATDPNLVEVNTANTAAITSSGGADDSPKTWSDITGNIASAWAKGMTKDALSVFGFSDELPPIMQAAGQTRQLMAVDEDGKGEEAVNADITSALPDAQAPTAGSADRRDAALNLFRDGTTTGLRKLGVTAGSKVIQGILGLRSLIQLGDYTGNMWKSFAVDEDSGFVDATLKARTAAGTTWKTTGDAATDAAVSMFRDMDFTGGIKGLDESDDVVGMIFGLHRLVRKHDYTGDPWLNLYNLDEDSAFIDGVLSGVETAKADMDLMKAPGRITAKKPTATEQEAIKTVAPGTVSKGAYKLGASFYWKEIATAAAERGLGIQGARIAGATMLTEVGTPPKMFASSVDTASQQFPHEAIGSDSDSSGLFQQRNNGGWGSIGERMNARGSASMFLNTMVKKFPNWRSMDPGSVAQGVQVSAFPDRYATHLAAADKALAKFKGKLPGFKNGGMVTAGRRRDGDDVLSWLSKGEVVINSRSVAASPKMATMLNEEGPGAVTDWILDNAQQSLSLGLGGAETGDLQDIPLVKAGSQTMGIMYDYGKSVASAAEEAASYVPELISQGGSLAASLGGLGGAAVSAVAAPSPATLAGVAGAAGNTVSIVVDSASKAFSEYRKIQAQMTSATAGV